MKFFNYLLLYTVFIAVLLSCKKSNSSSNGLASINIVQANMDIPSVYVYFTNADTAFYRQQAIVSAGSGSAYSTFISSPLTLVSTTDTTNQLLSTTLDLKVGNIYSLYISGQGSAVDTMLLQDFIPVHTDSSSGVRFINLSSGSQPISINLAGNDASQMEFNPIGYKQITAFKTYPDTCGISSYNFEVRDKATDNLLTTFQWSFSLFKNNTLVISGSEDPASSTPISVFAVNNY